MRARVQVAALLRLVELGADRERGPIPPEPAEHVRRPGRLVPPAARHEFAEPCPVEIALHLEAVAAVARHRLVAADALGPWVAADVPSFPFGLSGRPSTASRNVTHGLPPSGSCSGSSWVGSGQGDLGCSDHDRAAPALRNAVVGSVEHAPSTVYPSSLGPALNSAYSADRSSSGTFSITNAFGSALLERAQVLAPEAAPLKARRRRG